MTAATGKSGKAARGRGPARSAPPASRGVGRGKRVPVAPARRGGPRGERRLLFVAALLLATLVALIATAGYESQFNPIDVFVYQCYAHGFWQGQLPAHVADTQSCAASFAGQPRQFHSFPSEYPAAALAIFSLPLLLPWLSYGAAYMVWIGLILLLATGVLAWRGRWAAAAALPVYVVLAGWGFVLQRFDLLPGLCVLLALIAARRGRPRAAAAALAAGTLLKLFPIVLLPLLLIVCKRESGRWRLDIAAVFGAVCLLGVLPALALNPTGLAGSVAFLFGRPAELESMPGVLLWIAGVLGVGPAPGVPGGPFIAFSFNSLNVAGGGAPWGPLWTALGGVGLLAAYWRAWRGRDSLGRAMILALLIVLATGKVFSPQYVLWLLPLVALVEGMRLRWLLLAALVCAVMLGFYALPLGQLPWNPPFIALILARNLLVCALAALYLATPGDLRASRWPTTPLWRRAWPAR